MRFELLFSLLASLCLFAADIACAASASDFEVYNLVDELNITRLRGRLHVPASYADDPTTPRPLILFLHGSGESGSDNLAQINGNIDNLLSAAKARDAFLFAPQTNSGWEQSVLLGRAMTMIDRAIAERSVDPNRIYVTGLSMGGGGAWNFLHQFPERVAATVPICGIYPSSGFMPSRIVNEPIWAFHGRTDTTVPVEVTRDVVNSLLVEAGLPIPTYPPKFNNFGPNVTIANPPLDLLYTDVRGSHGIWPQVYAMPELYDWMFAHGAVPEPSAVMLVVLGIASIMGCHRIR
ncbi:MAG: dienelactone hydrolase family protein [Pirellulales bacterium]